MSEYHGMKFTRTSRGLKVEYDNLAFTFTPYSSNTANSAFKNAIIKYTGALKDMHKSSPEYGEYDGVIISDVKDYGGTAVDYDYEGGTVYECIDNSQVKSVFNNGEFANPDNMYASISDKTTRIAI